MKAVLLMYGPPPPERRSSCKQVAPAQFPSLLLYRGSKGGGNHPDLTSCGDITPAMLSGSQSLQHSWCVAVNSCSAKKRCVQLVHHQTSANAPRPALRTKQIDAVASPDRQAPPVLA